MQGVQSDRVRRIGQSALRYRNVLLAIIAIALAYAALGFLVAPWLVQKNAIESVKENFNASLRLENVAINPFVLSLRVDGLELDDPSGAAFARAEEIYVNFQLSSLLR